MNPTPEEKAAAVRSRMADLAAKFIARTGNDVTVMRAGLERLRQGDASPLAEILNLAHRASGTGATLGLHALSERAQKIELLVAAMPPGAVPDAPLWAELSSAIDALAAEAG
jgi:HPt (histidine-containing phosphotransfer) domain-containing protein